MRCKSSNAANSDSILEFHSDSINQGRLLDLYCKSRRAPRMDELLSIDLSYLQGECGMILPDEEKFHYQEYICDVTNSNERERMCVYPVHFEELDESNPWALELQPYSFEQDIKQTLLKARPEIAPVVAGQNSTPCVVDSISEYIGNGGKSDEIIQYNDVIVEESGVEEGGKLSLLGEKRVAISSEDIGIDHEYSGGSDSNTDEEVTSTLVDTRPSLRDINWFEMEGKVAVHTTRGEVGEVQKVMSERARYVEIKLKNGSKVTWSLNDDVRILVKGSDDYMIFWSMQDEEEDVLSETTSTKPAKLTISSKSSVKIPMLSEETESTKEDGSNRPRKSKKMETFHRHNLTHVPKPSWVGRVVMTSESEGGKVASYDTRSVQVEGVRGNFKANRLFIVEEDDPIYQTLCIAMSAQQSTDLGSPVVVSEKKASSTNLNEKMTPSESETLMDSSDVNSNSETQWQEHVMTSLLLLEDEMDTVYPVHCGNDQDIYVQSEAALNHEMKQVKLGEKIEDIFKQRHREYIKAMREFVAYFVVNDPDLSSPQHFPLLSGIPSMTKLALIRTIFKMAAVKKRRLAKEKQEIDISRQKQKFLSKIKSTEGLKAIDPGSIENNFQTEPEVQAAISEIKVKDLYPLILYHFINDPNLKYPTKRGRQLFEMYSIKRAKDVYKLNKDKCTELMTEIAVLLWNLAQEQREKEEILSKKSEESCEIHQKTEQKSVLQRCEKPESEDKGGDENNEAKGGENESMSNSQDDWNVSLENGTKIDPLDALLCKNMGVIAQRLILNIDSYYSEDEIIADIMALCDQDKKLAKKELR